MIRIETTRHGFVYLASGDVTRLVERAYEGGGTQIFMRDGTRIDTYKHIDGVAELIEKDRG